MSFARLARLLAAFTLGTLGTLGILAATPSGAALAGPGARHATPHARPPLQLAYVDDGDHPNLIVNGDFEEPALDDGSWDVFDEITGWHTASGPGIEIQRGVAGAPRSGAQHVELDSHASSSMYQEIDTRPGRRYVLTYWVSPRPGTDVADNRLEVRWGTKLVDTFAAKRVGNDTTWERRRIVLTAQREQTRLVFTDVSGSNGLGAYLDDVAVVELHRR